MFLLFLQIQYFILQQNWDLRSKIMIITPCRRSWMEKWRFICRLMRWNSRGLFFSLRITELPGSMQVVRNDIQKNYEVKIIWNNTAIMRKLEKSHRKRKQYKIVKTQEKAFISWVWMSFWAIRGNLCGKIILSTAWHRSSTARLKNIGSVCREQCVCQREIKGMVW